MIDIKDILAQNPWLIEGSVAKTSASTQLDAKANLGDKKLFISEMQTAARGRFGRQYVTEQGKGIYMSLSLKPSTAIKNYTILTAAAITAAIETLTSKKPQIKWVNDIYLDNKKIAGVLVEHLLSSDYIIIGIGLNFNQINFPLDLRDKAGSLFNEETPPITRTQLIAEIWRQFYKLQADETFFDIYRAHSFILGKTVEFEEQGETIIATAVDLTEHGELIVNTGGLIKVISSGEVSLKKWL